MSDANKILIEKSMFEKNIENISVAFSLILSIYKSNHTAAPKQITCMKSNLHALRKNTYKNYDIWRYVSYK